MRNHPNALLARLPDRDFRTIEPHLSEVALEGGRTLVESHEIVRHVLFPHDGVLSLLVELPSGGLIETGVIGRDGCFGAGQALDDQISLNRVAVQVPGHASSIEVKQLRGFALELPEFRKLLMGYELFILAQAQQTAACNAVHQIRQRTCKWLLRMQALAGDNLQLTQEFLAQMIGVRRTSVSAIAQELQRAGLIEYHRGRIRIRDRNGLAEASCECHKDVAEHYNRILGSRSETNRR